MAREMKRDERTIYRWLRELVENQLITSDQRGHTSALLTLNPLCFQKDWLENVRAVRAVSASPLCEIYRKDIKLASSTNYEEIELPPAYVTNEYGRTDRNPEHVRIMAVLRNARERIARADNPVAYEQAILRRELGRERKPPQPELLRSSVACGGSGD